MRMKILWSNWNKKIYFPSMLECKMLIYISRPKRELVVHFMFNVYCLIVHISPLIRRGNNSNHHHKFNRISKCSWEDPKVNSKAQSSSSWVVFSILLRLSIRFQLGVHCDSQPRNGSKPRKIVDLAS